jgi:hypothetical protein
MPTYDASDLKVNIDFECHVDGDSTKPIMNYQATVLFSNLEKLLERGGESVKRTLQTQARKGKFPTGRRVVVNEDGKFTQTLEDEIADMDEDKALKAFEILKAKFEAKKAKK